MINELIQYGLSDKEAKVYLSALKLGSATANRITEIVNLPRSTVYEVLERLKSQGLISTIVIDNKTNFIASKPKRLIELLEEKKQSVQKVLKSLNEIHAKTEERPTTEVFEGNLAVYKILDEILEKPNSEIKIIGSMKNAVEKIDYRTDRFRSIRKDRKIKVMQILEKSEESKVEKNDSLTKVKFLDSIKNTKEAIFILENCVYHILLQSEISAIKIKSKEHSNTMNVLFESLWRCGR